MNLATGKAAVSKRDGLANLLFVKNYLQNWHNLMKKLSTSRTLRLYLNFEGYLADFTLKKALF
jgi:hypothetical protein